MVVQLAELVAGSLHQIVIVREMNLPDVCLNEFSHWHIVVLSQPHFRILQAFSFDRAFLRNPVQPRPQPASRSSECRTAKKPFYLYN